MKKWLKNIRINYGYFLYCYNTVIGLVLFCIFCFAVISFFIDFIELFTFALEKENYVLQITDFSSSLFFSSLLSLFLISVCLLAQKSPKKNYLIAIDSAEKFIEKITSCGKLTGEISAKISILIAETKTTKNSEKLNEWVDNFKEIEEMKKEKEEAEKFLREASDKINSLTTKIYNAEKELFS
jgi:hypothetical protein